MMRITPMILFFAFSACTSVNTRVDTVCLPRNKVEQLVSRLGNDLSKSEQENMGTGFTETEKLQNQRIVREALLKYAREKYAMDLCP